MNLDTKSSKFVYFLNTFNLIFWVYFFEFSTVECKKRCIGMQFCARPKRDRFFSFAKSLDAHLHPHTTYYAQSFMRVLDIGRGAP